MSELLLSQRASQSSQIPASQAPTSFALADQEFGEVLTTFAADKFTEAEERVHHVYVANAAQTEFRILIDTNRCAPSNRQHVTSKRHLFVQVDTVKKTVELFCSQCRSTQHVSPTDMDVFDRLRVAGDLVKKRKDSERILQLREEIQGFIAEYEQRFEGHILCKDTLETGYSPHALIDKQDEVCKRLNVFVAAVPVNGGTVYAFRWSTKHSWTLVTEKKLQANLAPFNVTSIKGGRQISAFKMWISNRHHRIECDMEALGIDAAPKHRGVKRPQDHGEKAVSLSVAARVKEHWLELYVQSAFPEGRAADMVLHFLHCVVNNKVPPYKLALRGDHEHSALKALMHHLGLQVDLYFAAKDIEGDLGSLSWIDIRGNWNWRDVSFKNVTLVAPKVSIAHGWFLLLLTFVQAIVVCIPSAYNYRHMVFGNTWFVTDEQAIFGEVQDAEEALAFLRSTEAQFYATMPRPQPLQSMVERMKRATALFDSFADVYFDSKLKSDVTVVVDFWDAWRCLEDYRKENDTPLWNPNMSSTGLLFKNTLIKSLQKVVGKDREVTTGLSGETQIIKSVAAPTYV